VEAARTAVRSRLRRAGLDGLADDAALLTSELMTNAVLHAGTMIDFAFGWDATSVWVRVRDQSDAEPEPRDGPPTGAGGYGLRIVAALATHWGCDPEAGGGKTVWFELHDED
jgi:anti-sigma regulatory factor (Ser/Thr protein kinase)